jgi:TetR/AcrR family transcriptional regulator, cholesterol catabolism regulator
VSHVREAQEIGAGMAATGLSGMVAPAAAQQQGRLDPARTALLGSPSCMGGPMERQGYDEKLARILRTAASEIAEKGFHNTSIRDISRATGVSLAGLYYYFRSKDELLFLIQEHCFATVLDNLERLLQGVEDPAVRLRILVENHLRFFVANMQEMTVLSHEAGSLEGEYRRAVNAKKRRYTEICQEIMAGLQRPDSGMSPRTAAFTLFGMLNWIYNWYDPERDVPVQELAEQMSELFLRGYSAAPPPPAVREDNGDVAGPSIWRN